jgi:hypothetical protein
MMKNCARALMFVVAVSAATVAASSLPIPNRGTQLFLLLESPAGAYMVMAMDEASRPVLQQWSRYNPTYDFISAGATPTGKGYKLSVVRYVMTDDYIPREEHAEFSFPYTQQPRYRFFDRGHIRGFYRNSVHDIDAHEFLPRQTFNQAMQRTQHFVMTSRQCTLSLSKCWVADLVSR